MAEFADRGRKTHLYFNHSPITKLVIRQVLELPEFAAHKARSLVVSTRGQRLDVADVDELCFDDEALAHDIERAYAFFHDAPGYAFEPLTVFLPQTRYTLGHFLINSPLVETVHYIEEGVGTMAFARLDTRRESATRNTRNGTGVLENSALGRAFRLATRVPAHLLAHPGRVRDVRNLARFHATEVHFMWRPEWHPRVGRVFTFHDVWPASRQTILRFPVPELREPSGASALLLLPPMYRSAQLERFEARVRAFFDGLPPGHEVEVKCHPSDTEFRWLARCRELYPQVREVRDRMQEAALYCWAHEIPLCFHFNSSSKEYFKFLPWDEQQPPPAVVDLWPAPLRLVDVLAMDPASRPSSRFEYPVPASLEAEQGG